MKFTSVTAFSVLVLVSVFVSGSVMDALPIFIAMGMCIIYMDTFHIRVTCGASILGILVETIIQIAKHGFAPSVTWVEILLLAAIFTFGILMACNITLREQETDRQEIEYHVAYQEEITENMVKVVDNGNAHIEQLQSKLDNFQAATAEVTKSVDAISTGVKDTAENMEVSEREAAGRKLAKENDCAVLIKGGHGREYGDSDAQDLLIPKEDKPAVWFRAPFIENPNTHGTGCTLSSAIACGLAQGNTMEQSIQKAKDYLTGAIAAGLDLGAGNGPLNHFYKVTIQD